MSIIVAIHQPNYLPWIGYFHKIVNSHKFVFLDNVPFTKNGLQNRNRIKNPQGAFWITVPVLQKGLFGQMTYDVKINNAVDWKRKNWNAIYINYRKAASFLEYSDFFEDIYKKEWVRLTELNLKLLEFIITKLGIEVETFLASNLTCSGQGTDLLLDICKKLSAGIYLSGKSGKKYLDEKKFRDNNVKLEYHDFIHPVYEQLYGEFIPNLSVIDLLFNYGKKSIDIIRGEKKAIMVKK